MRRLLSSLFCASLVAWGLTSGEAAADGPYRGKVVDAGTKAPLVGAVVLVYWKREAPGIGHGPSESFLGAEEVLTDADGRFLVAKNPPRTWIPGTWRSKPYMIIFHPGYGYFPRHFATHPAGSFTTLLRIMEERDVTFELPALQTEEARRTVRSMLPPSSVPAAKMPNLIRLLNTPTPRPPLPNTDHGATR